MEEKMTTEIGIAVVGAIILGSSALGYMFGRMVGNLRIEQYKDALRWCGGSADFGEGGKARIGWLKICNPLVR